MSENVRETAPPDEPPTQKADSVSLWRGGAVPEPLAFGLALVLIAVCVGIVAVADVALARQAQILRRQQSDHAAQSVALAIADCADEEAERRVLDRFCRVFRATRALRTDATGKSIEEWPLSTAASSAPAESGAAAITFPTVSTSAEIVRDGAPAGRIALTLPIGGEAESRPVLLGWAGAVAAVALAAHVVLYRRIRRQTFPLTAIQQNIESYASGVEKQFAALALSDTLGQVARGWNVLIAEMAQLQAALPRGGQVSGSAALQRFETRSLRHILDRLPVGILRVAANRTVGYANPAARRMLQIDAASAGQALAEVLGDAETTEMLSLQTSAAATKPIDRKRGGDESAPTLRYFVLPLADEGSGGETVLTIEDVSHRQEAEKARDNFLYHVTHELRTPLTNIQAYAETLTKPAFDDEQTRRECYNVIVSETRRLSRLVEDILSISQLEVGSARFEVGELDLVRLLRQMVQDNLGGADSKKIELSLKVPPKAPKIRGDKIRMSVLLNNLIGNAVKYTPSGGRVNVTLELANRSASIAVSDTGIGIAEADQARVFEKFYRAASDEVQQESGTGLGLAIAREVARLHGGDIHVQSELGKGSMFTIELPLPEDAEGG